MIQIFILLVWGLLLSCIWDFYSLSWISLLSRRCWMCLANNLVKATVPPHKELMTEWSNQHFTTNTYIMWTQFTFEVIITNVQTCSPQLTWIFLSPPPRQVVRFVLLIHKHSPNLDFSLDAYPRFFPQMTRCGCSAEMTGPIWSCVLSDHARVSLSADWSVCKIIKTILTCYPKHVWPTINNITCKCTQGIFGFISATPSCP